MPRWRLLVCVVGFGLNLGAHDVISTKITWSREVSRIAYKRCISCHHEGGTAFSLVKYDEARPWAKAIKEEVLGRRMPPWNAVKGFGDFKNDVGLTQEQIEIIADWVEGGAPEGNPLYLPKPRVSQKPPLALPGAGSVQVTGTLALLQPAEFVAIQPGKLEPGGSVQITAALPDGGVEPLLWVENFNPAYDQPYFFANSLRLPAGSRIQVTPSNAPAVTLFRAAPSKAVRESSATATRSQTVRAATATTVPAHATTRASSAN